MQAWLLDLALEQGFCPWKPKFQSDFEEWAASRGKDSELYGRASHWYSPEVNVDRKAQQKQKPTIGWLADSVRLLQRFWDIVPFLHAVAGAGDLHMRAGAIQALLQSIPGVAAYGVKFVQGDLLELYNLINDGVHQLSLRQDSAVGPALRKAISAGALFAMTGHQAGAAVGDRLALCLIRFLFQYIVKRAQAADTPAGGVIATLLQARHETFPTRPAVFDLQDIQCKVCTWIMACGSGGGVWFQRWGATAIVVCSFVTTMIHSHTSNGSSCKRKRAAVFAEPSSLKETVPATDMTEKRLRMLLPTFTSGDKVGPKAIHIAALFGSNWPANAVNKANLLTEHTVLIPGPVGRLVLNPIGVAELLLNLPKGQQVRKVKAYCARVVARAEVAPEKRQGALGIAPWILSLARKSGVSFSAPRES
jgi:hypothetical protein